MSQCGAYIRMLTNKKKGGEVYKSTERREIVEWRQRDGRRAHRAKMSDEKNSGELVGLGGGGSGRYVTGTGYTSP